MPRLRTDLDARLAFAKEAMSIEDVREELDG